MKKIIFVALTAAMMRLARRVRSREHSTTKPRIHAIT